MLSRNEAPVGRGLTFVPGNVQTRIRLITRRHSLLPTSQARTPVGSPHGSLSLASEGGIQGFHVSLLKYAGLGACCRPGSSWITRRHRYCKTNLPLPWSLSASLAPSAVTIFITDSRMFTIPASWPSPAMWLAGGRSSHDSLPAHRSVLLYFCQDRSLFRSIGSPSDMGGSRST